MVNDVLTNGICRSFYFWCRIYTVPFAVLEKLQIEPEMFNYFSIPRLQCDSAAILNILVRERRSMEKQSD